MFAKLHSASAVPGTENTDTESMGAMGSQDFSPPMNAEAGASGINSNPSAQTVYWNYMAERAGAQKHLDMRNDPKIPFLSCAHLIVARSLAIASPSAWTFGFGSLGLSHTFLGHV